MNEQIDWSKAPEGAMVLLKHVRDDSYAWAVSHSEDARAWNKWNIRRSFHLMASMWSVVAERPAAPSWSGEGLPPVGVVCEYNPMPVGKPKKWHKVEVVYASEWVIVMRCIEAPSGHEGGNGVEIAMAVDSCSLEDVRPIRTPEQIAADEREEFARNLTLEMGKDCDSSTNAMNQARKMYDLGYRKP